MDTYDVGITSHVPLFMCARVCVYGVRIALIAFIILNANIPIGFVVRNYLQLYVWNLLKRFTDKSD